MNLTKTQIRPYVEPNNLIWKFPELSHKDGFGGSRKIIVPSLCRYPNLRRVLVQCFYEDQYAPGKKIDGRNGRFLPIVGEEFSLDGVKTYGI